MDALFRLDDIAVATGGVLHAGSGGQGVRGVATDSRRVAPGDLFVALRGSRADGHDFVAEAFRRGAAACLVERADAVPAGAAAVLVEDSLLALGSLARWHVERLRRSAGLRVVAVTGSVGKTTTRHLCTAVLAAGFRVLEAEENLNTEVGVPLTCLRATAAHQVLVLEFAMRGLGQIRYLAGLARPDVGVVTRIGPSHLELLGSVERVAEAKGELVEALPADGIAILNADDPWQRGFAGRTRARVVRFGRDGAADVRAEREEGRGRSGTAFRLQIARGLPVLPGPEADRQAATLGARDPGDAPDAAPVSLPLVGGHQVENALAAAACGAVFGLRAARIAQALAAARPVPGRVEVRDLGRIVVVDDAYNASPQSARAALHALADMAPPERRVAVLGDMRELGAAAEAGHRQVGQDVVDVGVRLLVAVGPQAAWIAAEALDRGLDPSAAVHCPDREAARRVLAERLHDGDVVLVKGSRGMRMEALVDFLEGWARGA